MCTLKHPQGCKTHCQLCGVKTPLWEVAIGLSHYLRYFELGGGRGREKKDRKKLWFFMTLKRQSGVPRETCNQILSIGMACQCKYACEAENYPCLAAYIELECYLPGHCCNSVINEKRWTSKWSYMSHPYQNYISAWDLSLSRALFNWLEFPPSRHWTLILTKLAETSPLVVSSLIKLFDGFYFPFIQLKLLPHTLHL